MSFNVEFQARDGSGAVFRVLEPDGTQMRLLINGDEAKFTQAAAHALRAALAYGLRDLTHGLRDEVAK